MFTSAQLRQKYIDFFISKAHAQVVSASTIPDADDQTVLFTTAGMQQFVPNLMGKAHPQGTKLLSVQKCVRTVDIDEVGDNRHLTFFEMLGNWSLGDYFKKESIQWSYEFLIDELKIDKDKLWVTVYGGDESLPYDKESHDIWKSIGIPEHKIVGIGAPTDPEKRRRKGRGDNFWAAGATGPCGPCSEMFIWLGEGEPKTGQTPETDEDNFIEVWNNVFMAFEQNEDTSLSPLANKNVDTGMGLERLTMIIQGKTTVFETDMYNNIMAQIENLSGKKYLPYSGNLDENNPTTRAFRVIADHVRCSSHLIADGVAASNEGRGYVLRRLLRRAVRFGKNIGIKNFLEKIAKVYIDEFKSYYPEIGERQQVIFDALKIEEEQFLKTLERGEKKLEEMIDEQTLDKTEVKIKEISLKDFCDFGFENFYKEQNKVSQKEFETEAQKMCIVSFGAYRDGVLIGSVGGEKLENENKFLIRGMVVLPEYRRKGVATQLIDTVNTWAQSNGYYTSCLWANYDSLEFYNSVERYTNTGKQKDKYNCGKMSHTLFEMDLDHNPTCNPTRKFSGKDAFMLFDTYGFPFDLTREIVEEKGFAVCEEEFNTEMKVQRERSRANQNFEMKNQDNNVFDDLPATEFVGDTGMQLENVECMVLAFIDDGGGKGRVVLDKTPFYAEGGGQVGDRGSLVIPAKAGISEELLINVTDTKKLANGVYVHYIDSNITKSPEEMIIDNSVVNNSIFSSVNTNLRARTIRHHSAAHLLQAALFQVLGDGIEQAGSLVDENRTRFDFSYPKAMTAKEIRKTEEIIAQWVLESHPITVESMSIHDAKAKGAVALFSEKYGDTVRTVKMGTPSFELCGGTHITNTSEIGAVKIISETSVASGVRRIEMVVGMAAQEYLLKNDDLISGIAGKLKTAPVKLEERIGQIITEKKEMNDEIKAMEKKLMSFEAEEFYVRRTENNGKVIVCEPVPTHDMQKVGGMARALSSKGVDLVALFTEDGGLAIATQKGGVDAREILKKIQEIGGGNGGGSPFFVQGKGVNLERFPEVRGVVEGV